MCLDFFTTHVLIYCLYSWKFLTCSEHIMAIKPDFTCFCLLNNIYLIGSWDSFTCWSWHWFVHHCGIVLFVVWTLSFFQFSYFLILCWLVDWSFICLPVKPNWFAKGFEMMGKLCGVDIQMWQWKSEQKECLVTMTDF